MKLADKTKEILKANNLDFTIVKRPMRVYIGGELVETDTHALINNKIGKVIGTCKKGYVISQTKDVVHKVVKGMQGFRNLSTVYGGAIHDGKKIYLQLAIEGDALIGNDTIKRYVTVLDSNDGSSSLSIGIGNLTMSCANQFFKFYKASDAHFRHSASITEKLDTIPNLIEFALLEDMRMTEIYKAFQKTPITKKLVDGLLKNLIGVETLEEEMSKVASNKLLELRGAISLEMKGSVATPSVEAIRGNKKLGIEGVKAIDAINDYEGKGENLWGLFSGVTRWTTHTKSAPKRENGRIESMVLGSNYTTNQSALDYCLEALNVTLKEQGVEEMSMAN